MSVFLESCQGKWRSIHGAIGIDDKFLNRKNGPCPLCGGKDRWRWTDYEGRGCWHCNNCGHGDGAELVKLWLKCDFRAAADKIREVLGQAIEERGDGRDENAKREAMRKLWVSGKPISAGGVADRYFRERGIALAAFPTCLREVPGMMIAQIIGQDGKAVNIHRTFFDAAGRKTERKMMPGSCPHGSTIRLSPVSEEMGVAEGLETALSAAILFGIPVWSCISDGGLAKFVPPPTVKKLWVFGDYDAGFAGQAAAYALAKAMVRKMDVEVRLPENFGEDFNDILMRKEGP